MTTTDRLLRCQLSQLVLIEVKDELSHVRHVADNQWIASRLLLRLTNHHQTHSRQ